MIDALCVPTQILRFNVLPRATRSIILRSFKLKSLSKLLFDHILVSPPVLIKNDEHLSIKERI
jgi:hypothetical protein